MSNSTTRLHIRSDESTITSNVVPHIFNTYCNKSQIKYNIESLTVPKSYYNFYTQQSVFFVATTAADTTLTYGPGNFSADQFFDFLTDEMTTFDGVATYSWSLNTITNLVEIESDIIGTWSLTFETYPLSKYVGSNLGEEYVSNIDTVTLSYVPNFERTANFIISGNINSLGDTSHDNISNYQRLSSENIIVAVLPCRFQKFRLATSQMMSELDLSFHSEYYGNYGSMVKCGSMFPTPITLQLRDDDYELIDLNGGIWTIDIFLYLSL